MKPDLVSQPPGTGVVRKVKGSAYSAAASGIPAAVLVAMLARWFDLDVTPEEAIVIGSLVGSAVAALASLVGGYRTRERADVVFAVPRRDVRASKGPERDDG